MPKLKNSLVSAAALAALMAYAPAAPAQEGTGLVAPSAFDLQLREHALELPQGLFTAFACGTRGGPPSLRIADWNGYDRCRPEAETGWREVYFEYDNEMELWTKANNLETMAAVYQFTSAYGIPMIASALFDEQGFMRGLRLVSDPRVPGARRDDALEYRELGSTLGGYLMARYGVSGWVCEDLPRLDGETPYQSLFEKRRCVIDMPDQQSRATVEMHHYRKRGQSALDYANRLTEGLFVSDTIFEVVTTGDIADADARLDRIKADREKFQRDQAALIEKAANCPGCDLSGVLELRGADLSGANLANADLSHVNLEDAILTNANLSGANLERANLKRADLTGANLSGANLERVNLHEARLRSADLSGVTGEIPNLNGADLRLAKLNGAVLDGALLYSAALDGADLSGANLTDGKARHSTMARATAQNAILVMMDLRDSRLNDADFRGADIRGTWLDNAQMTRSDLSGALLSQSLLRKVNLSNAKLVGATLRASDLSQALLRGADMTNADFSFATLLYVVFGNATITGANWTDATLSRGALPLQK